MRYVLLTCVLALLLAGCAPPNPLKELREDLSAYPTWSIILEDMKVEGNDFYHRYRLVWAETLAEEGEEPAFEESMTEWQRVSREFAERYQPYLGMTILAKTPEGDIVDTPIPPGYQYIDNPRYGEWREDNNGNSFWAFYGRFAFMQSMFGLLGGPGGLGRGDYVDYQDSRRRGVPYFGPTTAGSSRYGTSGSYTQRSHPSFFERQQARQRSGQSSFSSRVRSRMGRSNMSSFRGRSGGFGK